MLEPIALCVSAKLIWDRGLWMPFCDVTGTNEWARNEGQVSDDQLFALTEGQAVAIGLLPPAAAS